MTREELQKSVSESPEYEWLQSRKIDFVYRLVNREIHLIGIPAIFDFVSREIEVFNGYSVLPGELEICRRLFLNVQSGIEGMIMRNEFGEGNWNNLISQIDPNRNIIFLAESEETEFLVRLREANEPYARGAYEYFIGNTNNATQKEYLVGYLLAYDFTKQRIFNKLDKKISLANAVQIKTNELSEALSNSYTLLTEHLVTSSEKVRQASDEIDLLKNSKDKAISDWFESVKNHIQSFNESNDTRMIELESLYKDKLKLEAPAKYWSDRAERLRQDGRTWLNWLIGSIIIVVLVLSLVLYLTADGTLAHIFDNTGTAIKWSIILITLISFLAFGVRVFSKLAFSSFHLVRDAEEREQLTYVYLALKNEKGIDDTERHLIMQSLFSRADSGLLKDEAPPTMPGLVDKLMSR
jgi:Family of unknown function (DUF6161)